jgi:2-polyprenyl-3-methyl-5-hydroxy-6-metoxy-1,4-benzoquinol methylase
MSDFFDFLRQGRYEDAGVRRLNIRYDHIISPLEPEIVGARVLDLGSYDGRWPYAIAAAGARSVLGIEGRADLIAEFAAFPDRPYKGNVNLIQGDFIVAMDDLIARGETFDLVFCLGVFYHTMQHYRMMLQMAALKPKVIVIDSVFSTAKEPVIHMVRNDTSKNLNSIPDFEGQAWNPAGIPSLRALRMMALSTGYAMNLVQWSVEQEKRRSVSDYFDKLKGRRRHTVVLRPLSH